MLRLPNHFHDREELRHLQVRQPSCIH